MFQASPLGLRVLLSAAPANPHPVSNPPPCERILRVSVGPLGRERGKREKRENSLKGNEKEKGKKKEKRKKGKGKIRKRENNEKEKIRKQENEKKMKKEKEKKKGKGEKREKEKSLCDE